MEQANYKCTFSADYFLTPGECNGEQRMPLWLLVNRIIEVATLHANSWNAGYRTLKAKNQAWVLSRVAVEMKEFPPVETRYRLTTWVESYNRHFSERNVEIATVDGKILGYARTIWSIIDTETREGCDLSAVDAIRENVESERECPIAKQSRVRAVEHRRESRYTFRYSDIDFNRHVNSVHYITLLLDQWPLEHYDSHTLRRFEIAYMREGYVGEEVTVGVDDAALDNSLAEIVTADGTVLCRARLVFEKNNQ